MRKLLSKKLAVASATVAVMLGMSGLAQAAEAPAAGAAASSGEERYVLRLHHLHTGEDIDIVYRIVRLPDPLEQQLSPHPLGGDRRGQEQPAHAG